MVGEARWFTNGKGAGEDTPTAPRIAWRLWGSGVPWGGGARAKRHAGMGKPSGSETAEDDNAEHREQSVKYAAQSYCSK